MNHVEQSLVGSRNEGLSVLAVDVGKPSGFHDKPKPFDGIEVGRVRRKVKRLEEMPVETFAFVPRGVVENEDVAPAGGFDRAGRLVEKGLKDFRIAVRRLDGEEFTRARANRAEDAEAHMIAILDASRTRSFERQTPTRPGFAFDAGFVAEPKVDLRIAFELGQSGAKRFSQFLILAIGPRLRDLEDEALFVKKTQEGLVRAFDLVGGGDVSVEGFGRGERLGAVLFFLEILDNALGFRGGNLARRARARFDDKAVDSALVESAHPLAQRTARGLHSTPSLLARRSGNEHEDRHTASLGLVGTGANGRVQLAQRGVFGVGQCERPRHLPSMAEVSANV